MNLNFLTDYYVPVVIIACLIVGYCIKHITWLDKVSNQYIPAILAVLGAVLGCIASGTIGLNTIVYGAFSGLASTGLHQAFTKIIEREDKENE
ncbi:MAG: phage holin family protein [Lachnospiraceae bacterium]|nr:phage holin family protein [Lachnospiraceae bacterium]